MNRWNGATAFITGGTSGIGRALALALAKRGAVVLVAGRNEEAAHRVASECGASAEGCRLDVRDAQAVSDRIVAFARNRGHLDYLFNNAGVAIGGDARELPLAHWERALDVNVRGVLHGICAAYPLMVKQGSGHIINTASIAGLIPAPLLTPYAMTKHAVVGLSTTLRIEAAPLGVRVSALCPGVIDTPILDSQMPADLPQIAHRSDGRSFFARAGITPYPVDAFAEEAIAAIERNQGVIVIPRRAWALWRIASWLPALVEWRAEKMVGTERAYQGLGPASEARHR